MLERLILAVCGSVDGSNRLGEIRQRAWKPWVWVTNTYHTISLHPIDYKVLYHFLMLDEEHLGGFSHMGFHVISCVWMGDWCCECLCLCLVMLIMQVLLWLNECHPINKRLNAWLGYYALLWVLFCVWRKPCCCPVWYMLYILSCLKY